MFHRSGQYHNAIGCSLATVWQCAMHEGVNIPTAGFAVTGANATRISAPYCSRALIWAALQSVIGLL